MPQRKIHHWRTPLRPKQLAKQQSCNFDNSPDRSRGATLPLFLNTNKFRKVWKKILKKPKKQLIPGLVNRNCFFNLSCPNPSLVCVLYFAVKSVRWRRCSTAYANATLKIVLTDPWPPSSDLTVLSVYVCLCVCVFW